MSRILADRVAGTLRCAVALVAALAGLGSWSAGSLSAAEPAAIDWTPWKQLPVYHRGRIMPLDSFAREVVEAVTGRQSPKLGLAGVVPPEKLKGPEYSEARKLFGPEGEARKFQPSELLLSWLLEPDKWDQAPFLIAHNEELRKQLRVATHGPDGKPLWFVSPNEVTDSDGAQALNEAIEEKRQQAQLEGREFRPVGVDAKFQDLLKARYTYLSLTLAPRRDPEVERRMQPALEEMARQYQAVRGDLDFLSQLGDTHGVGRAASQIQAAFDGLVRAASNPEGDDDFEGQVLQIAESSAALRGELETLARRLETESAPPEVLQNLKPTLGKIGTAIALLSDSADRVVDAYTHSSSPLRIVPALNAAALDSQRDVSQMEQPWLDLGTILHAPPYALRHYPASQVLAVRSAFAEMAKAYTDREKNPQAFSESLRNFADAVARLGRKIEPLRNHLEIANRDEGMIEHTSYPSPEYTAPELRYNELDPFKWTWIISFGSLAAFTVGLLTRSKAAFWVALCTLLAALAMACYGFYLRMLITGWAPVTGMYESVIYMPLVAAGVGVWLCLQPMILPGFKAAWRMTALPGTWESSELDETQREIAEPSRWVFLQLALFLPRLALSGLTFAVLALWPYAAGGRTIINLLPNHETGSIPDFNSLLTWSVGLAMLVPTVWYLPRLVLACVLSLVTTPLTLRGRLSETVEKVYPRAPFLAASSLVATFFWLLAWYTPVLPKEFSPLQPVLRDNFWLTIHVLTIVSSYAAGALAWILGNIALTFYLFGRYREAPGDARRPPEICLDLSGYIYKTVQLAVLLLAAGTILGGLWADVSWGRFWGWDPKEVWALISCLVYLALLHARYTGWLNHFGMAAGTVAGASAIAMSWYGVNFVLGEGKHSYGFVEGSQGQWQVATALALNWFFVAAAGWRYLRETGKGRRAASEAVTLSART